VLAAGLAKVLVEEHLVPVEGPLPPPSFADAAPRTGLTSAAIRELAHTMVERRPTVFIGADENPAIAALNVLLGAVGTVGGIVSKFAHPCARPPARINGTRPRAVLIDSTVAWEFVPPSGAEIFRFAAWDGGGNPGDWLLPAPGFLEETTDVPTAPTSAVATYAIAPNLLTAATPVKTAAEFLLQIDSRLPTIEQTMQARCEEIFRAGRGVVHGGEPAPVSGFDCAAKLERDLRAGGVWLDRPTGVQVLKCSLKEWPTDGLVHAAASWASAWRQPVMPPLAAKLYQESCLREAPQRNRS
jgi:hypothetical protein